jgi:hypothetical protein
VEICILFPKALFQDFKKQAIPFLEKLTSMHALQKLYFRGLSQGASTDLRGVLPEDEYVAPTAMIQDQRKNPKNHSGRA